MGAIDRFWRWAPGHYSGLFLQLGEAPFQIFDLLFEVLNSNVQIFHADPMLRTWGWRRIKSVSMHCYSTE
jgi:hypothetical protein